jgi:hypothetical protein
MDVFTSSEQRWIWFMAMETGTKLPEADSSRNLVKTKNLIFFLNGDLHRLIKTNAAANICYAFNYNKNEVVKYPYKDYKKFRKPAFKIGEVATILRRHRDRIRRAFIEGHVSKPILIDYKGRTGVYYFSEEDIYELREYFAGVHRGRPRADGIIVSKNVPTEAEVDAVLGKTPTLYVRTKEGNFVPVWKAEEFG